MPPVVPTEDVDALLVGGGVMSATLGVLLSQLQPDWRIAVLERLDQGGLESSAAWMNAGTGHAGLCEFNYTPRRADGSVDVTAAVRIGEQFAASLRLWADLVAAGDLDPSFVRPVAHLGLGRGAEGVAHLRGRREALAHHPLFADTRFTQDREEAASWVPLVTRGRTGDEPFALTRSGQGTDVDYGTLTRGLLQVLTRRGAEVSVGQHVSRLRRHGAGWAATVTDRRSGLARRVRARFVFVGAGGATLPVLQAAGVPEVRGLGAFPISGRFLRTSDPELVAAHRGKLYGHAAPGAPPISVPHLDLRTVEGREHLLFGPFAAFSPRFLRTGRRSDLLRSVRPHAVPTLLATARDNRALTAHLVGQLAQTPTARTASLRGFVPTARAADWELVTAGQRVQLLERTGGRGAMVGFGTRVVTSAGGSLGALLGASPGASTAVAVMVDLLDRCFPARAADWADRLARHRGDTLDLDAVADARSVLGLPAVGAAA
ncbi:malate dehydrogenase (quinone) [Modestobacter sp. Leaf380]|uniref:malate dehydrogenase (quinone) n=1 Tax=Modestobacter sp. Leaf380 TaxID=1736356 RepID=UPI000701A407|nr:malate dehydrogenase (quinone) [Modestobacter sp. Leaf380]KQS71144.1 malate:quinone oxidoreductase [Modestobacter sp. Leaf380]